MNREYSAGVNPQFTPAVLLCIDSHKEHTLELVLSFNCLKGQYTRAELHLLILKLTFAAKLKDMQRSS